MSNLVFDIEADGLTPTKIHCIVALDVDTKDVLIHWCCLVCLSLPVKVTTA